MVANMTKMIQVRNVPDSLHARLKARAALAGMPLSEYLLAELRRVGSRPTWPELFDEVVRDGPVHLSELPEEAVRAERDARA